MTSVDGDHLELAIHPLDSGSAEARWTARSELPLAAAATIFLAAYAWPILQPDLTQSVKHTCSLIIYIVWGLFAADYVARLALARDRWRFVRRNIIDLVSIVVPVLRPLRLLRLVALIRVLNRRATASLHGRVAIYVTASASLIIFVAALAVLDAERGKPHANIQTFGDALWWAATTVMTVGYGDRVPVTITGRFVAVGLMIGGITLLGIVTASLATWLIGRVRAEEATTDDHITRRIDALHTEIRQMKQLLQELVQAGERPGAVSNPATPPSDVQLPT